MAEKAEGGEARFRLSRDDTPIRDLVAHRRRHGPFTLDDLIVRDDPFTEYWLSVLRVARRHGGSGQGLGVVIIDSGIADDVAIPTIDRERSLDLTGEGLSKGASHGTAISLLYEAVAPKLKQFHIKLFRADGGIPGANYGEKIGLIEKAFEHAAQLQARIANISWNIPTAWRPDSPNNFRVNNFCKCRLCEATASFARSTGINVFVSEGNFFAATETGDSHGINRLPTGFYSCPAAACQVIPILAFENGVPRYSSNLQTLCALPAPAAAGLRRRPTFLSSIVHRTRAAQPSMLIGSSFSTPLVAGSFAALLSAFCEHGLDQNLIVPKNPADDEEPDEDGVYKVSYNFPLNLFVQPPKISSEDGPEEQELDDWKLMYNVCHRKVEELHGRGEHHAAGRLCCLTANLMLVAFRRMEKRTEPTLVGKMAVELYMAGIRLLYHWQETSSDLRTSLGGYFRAERVEPLSCPSEHFESVAEALKLLRQRGERGAALAQVENDLKDLGSFDFAIPPGWVSELLKSDDNAG